MDEETRLSMPAAIAIIGKPGSGKSKFAKWLSRRFAIPVYDMGEILREVSQSLEEPSTARDNEMSAGSNTKLLETMNSGGLVSTGRCARLLSDRLSVGAARGFVLVGFPRSVEQIPYFYELLNGTAISRAVFFVLDVPDNVARARAGYRRKKDGSSARADDNDSVFDTRLRSYYEETAPMVEKLLNDHPSDSKRVASMGMKNRELLNSVVELVGGEIS